jgi:hypothetical protein
MNETGQRQLSKLFTGTVNGISNQETAVFDAYGYMRDAINKKGVHLQTFDPKGVVSRCIS